CARPRRPRAPADELRTVSKTAGPASAHPGYRRPAHAQRHALGRRGGDGVVDCSAAAADRRRARAAHTRLHPRGGCHACNLRARTRRVAASLLVPAVVVSIRRSGGGGERGGSAPRVVFLLLPWVKLPAISAGLGVYRERFLPSPYASPIFGGTAFGPIQLLAD